MVGTATAPQTIEPKGEITVNLKPTSQQINPTPQQLKDFLSQEVKKYGYGNYAKLYDVLMCESNFNSLARNGNCFGVAQFKKPTFDLYCKGSYYNAYDQIDCFLKMMDSGLQHNWECWKILKLN